MLRTRWSPHHRGTLRTLGIPASALCLFLLAGSVASAAPTPNSLHERLTRLNAQADQAVEQYLQAKLALQQTQGSAASLRRRAADARKERDRLSAVIAAQAADTYVNGAGAGLASVLGAEDPNVAFDRMQTLSVLAQHNSDRLADLRAAEQVYQQGLAALTKVQRQQAAELHRLATRKAQVQQLGSGLTMMAWRQAGISLPHSAAAQYTVGRHVTRSELQPGDLIFRYSPISHVAMYVGNGMQVAATHTGSTVKLQSAFQGEIVGYSRPTG